MERMVRVAKDEGIERICGCIMAANIGMQKVCKKAGFQLQQLPDGDYRADLTLAK